MLRALLLRVQARTTSTPLFIDVSPLNSASSSCCTNYHALVVRHHIAPRLVEAPHNRDEAAPCWRLMPSCYTHPLLQRGRRDLAKKIKRRPPAAKRGQTFSSHFVPPCTTATTAGVSCSGSSCVSADDDGAGVLSNHTAAITASTAGDFFFHRPDSLHPNCYTSPLLHDIQQEIIYTFCQRERHCY